MNAEQTKTEKKKTDGMRLDIIAFLGFNAIGEDANSQRIKSVENRYS